MRSTHVSTVLGWAATAVIAVGLAIGLFLPVHADGTNCGSAFKEANPFLASPTCDQARNTPRLASFIVMGFGGAVGVGALVQGWVEGKQEERDEHTASSRGAAS